MDPSFYFDFQLTLEQEQAFRMLSDFIEDPGQRIFILKGYAGTGKTTLVRGIIKRIEEIYNNGNENPDNSGSPSFVLLASTGRAAKVLKDKSGHSARTIHSQIGDPCQLPPITQSLSPALSEEYIFNEFAIQAISTELTDIVRQNDGNGIIHASLQIRELWKKNPPVRWAFLPLKGNNNIQFYFSGEHLLEQYMKKLSETGKEHVTFLCHTNKQCLHFNQIIRRLINGDHVGVIVPGDLLIVTQNNYLCPLVNGDLVLVTKIGNREFRAGLCFLNIEVEELSSRNRYTLPLIEEILYSGVTNINTQQHKKLFVDFYLRMKNLGIEQKSLLFKEEMMKDPYLNALRAVHGYALTCHKSQGGEWEEVFLYMDTGIQKMGKPEIYQWWYTAVTRAKTTLHVIDNIFIT